jgi:hypothetical protein
VAISAQYRPCQTQTTTPVVGDVPSVDDVFGDDVESAAELQNRRRRIVRTLGPLALFFIIATEGGFPSHYTTAQRRKVGW